MYALATTVGLFLACPAGSLVDETDGARAAASLDAWCIDCHGGSKPKGKFNLDGVLDRLTSSSTTASDRSLLRKALRRFSAGEMPPPESDEHPDALERAAGAEFLRHAIASADRVIVPRGGPPRRLNRAEYSNTLRDLLGIDVSEFGSLPPDDVGAGFDNVGAVLSLAPTALEKYVTMAEAIAARAVPNSSVTKPVSIVVAGKTMNVTEGAGRTLDAGAVLWSQGEARFPIDLPRAGTYAISLRAGGDQAGPEAVRIGVLAGKKRIADFKVKEGKQEPGTFRVERALKDGEQSIALTFDNDYYIKDGPGGKPADRNAFIVSLTIDGPLEPYRTPAWQFAMDAAAAGQPASARNERAQRWLVERFLRRAATAADLALLASVTSSLPSDSTSDERLRAVLVALLVHPEFLFRTSTAAGSGDELAPSDLATRMAYFIWASCPDEKFASAAQRGELATPIGRAKAVERLLQDPRSSTLAERFATQWLAIDGLGQKMPDSSQFPDVDAALLRSMRTETVMFFESVLRENRPVETLIDSDYTFVNPRLAKHYGMTTPQGDGMTRVPADSKRGGGVLAHASVLTATSNPTRTSPVKRGKWVLDALLDAAPPPPPPGTKQIPEKVEDRGGKSIRELMEIHRSDPNCAACHRTMDAIGFAFESFDPVGRVRDRADGFEVNNNGTLPDGSELAGLNGLRRKLRGNPEFTRALVKHMMVYATGCAQEESSDDEIDELMGSLPTRPTLQDIVRAVVESPSFRLRGAE